jgi:beta-phosphoglucomutase family hydrolase
MAEIKAVIWDMDGVIADTAPYHFRAWQQVFRKREVNYTKENFRRNFGLRNDTIIRNILGEQIAQDEIDAITREKEETYRKVARQNIRPLPGAVELIKSLMEHKFKMAIASSAPMENIQLVTRSLGIDNCFQAIVTGQDVAEGKPSPQGFLLAAQRLGVEPKNCVVIEDAVAGVAAAKTAGMRCLAITSNHPRQSLKQADLIVDTLKAVSINDIEGLLHPP